MRDVLQNGGGMTLRLGRRVHLKGTLCRGRTCTLLRFSLALHVCIIKGTAAILMKSIKCARVCLACVLAGVFGVCVRVCVCSTTEGTDFNTTRQTSFSLLLSIVGGSRMSVVKTVFVQNWEGKIACSILDLIRAKQWRISHPVTRELLSSVFATSSRWPESRPTFLAAPSFFSPQWRGAAVPWPLFKSLSLGLKGIFTGSGFSWIFIFIFIKSRPVYVHCNNMIITQLLLIYTLLLTPTVTPCHLVRSSSMIKILFYFLFLF